MKTLEELIEEEVIRTDAKEEKTAFFLTALKLVACVLIVAVLFFIAMQFGFK